MKEIKQNKNSSVSFKRVFALVSSFVVLLFSLSFPAFADTSFSGQPFPGKTWGSVSDWQTIYNASAPFCVLSENGTAVTYHLANTKTTHDADYEPLYAFLAAQSNGDIVGFLCGQSAAVRATISTFWGSTYAGSTQNVSNLEYDSSSQLYFWPIGFTNAQSVTSSSVPVFSSGSAGFSSLRSYLGDPSSPNLTGAFSTSLQPGYAMYVDVTNLNVNFQLSQTTPISYWGLGASQFYGVVSSIPSITTESTVSNIIPWNGSGRADTFGKFTDWTSSLTISGITSDHNHAYLCIINPMVNNSVSGSGYDVDSIANGVIKITATNSNSVKIFPMNTSFNGGVYNSSSGDQSATGRPDGNGGLTYLDDSTGEQYNQQYGGLTEPPSTNSINDWLANIANTIGNFFKGSINAVSTLVSAGRDFMQSVSSLYMWLPSPVYAVLTSAIILVITIGVIKVFI